MVCLLLFIPLLCFGATGDITAARISNASPGDGWILELDISGLSAGGTYAFGMNANNSDPENAKVVLTVTSEGYNTSAVLGTTTRPVYGKLGTKTGAVRKAYPNETSPREAVADGTLTVQIPLSDFIYKDDTNITVSVGAGFYTEAAGDGGTASNAVTDLAVTNNSTLAYPSSVGRWAKAPYEQVKTPTYDVEASIFHRFAKEGKPLAAVVFTATDEHAHSVSYTVNDMTVSDYPSASSNKVLVYKATIDLSTLTALDKITVNFKAYPWVGDAASILDSSANADPDERLTDFIFLNDKSNTLLGGCAVVDPTNGATWSSGHANVGTMTGDLCSAETAYNGNTALSWKTIGDASKAIKDYNDNHSGTGNADVAGGTILLIAGNHAHPGVAWATAAAATNTWVTIQPVNAICGSYPCADTTSVVINSHTSGQYLPANTKICVRNITMNSSSVLELAGAASTHLWIDYFNWVNSGGAYLSSIGYTYVTNNSGSYGVAFVPYSTNKQAYRLLRGNNMTAIVSAQPYCALGNSQLYPIGTSTKTGNTYGLNTNDNGIWAFNSMVGATTQGWNFDSTDLSTGYALIQNLIEAPANGVYYAGSIMSPSASNNALMWHNTVMGNRFSYAYNEMGSTSHLHTNYHFFGNVIGHNVNTKVDTFSYVAGKAMTGLARGATTTVTCNANGLTNGYIVYIQGLTGEWAAMNGNSYTVSSKATNSFVLDYDSSGLTGDCATTCGTWTMANPARTGSWSVLHDVGFYSNVFKDSSGGTEWFGDSLGLYSTAYDTATLTFVHDGTEYTGDSSKTNPEYHIHSNNSAYNIIPSGKNVLPYDLEGRRRKTESDDAGCYVRGLPKVM